MIVDILCSSSDHPVNEYILRWIELNQNRHVCHLKRTVAECLGGDILFLISCSQIVREDIRKKYRHAVVLHASDLPAGRGWSPYIWDILSGMDRIVLCLLVAADPVDSGCIWKKINIDLDGTELFNEINEKLFNAELNLMDWFLDNCDLSEPVPQIGEPSFYPRRSPEDSRLDVNETISNQFNLLRVCDPQRYPAYFEYQGCRYTIRIEKVGSV